MAAANGSAIPGASRSSRPTRQRVGCVGRPRHGTAPADRWGVTGDPAGLAPLGSSAETSRLAGGTAWLGSGMPAGPSMSLLGIPHAPEDRDPGCSPARAGRGGLHAAHRPGPDSCPLGPAACICSSTVPDFFCLVLAAAPCSAAQGTSRSPAELGQQPSARPGLTWLAGLAFWVRPYQFSPLRLPPARRGGGERPGSGSEGEVCPRGCVEGRASKSAQTLLATPRLPRRSKSVVSHFTLDISNPNNELEE